MTDPFTPHTGQPRDATAPHPGARAEIVAALGGHAPTRQQWEAISHPPRPVAVIAGAGSGKTAVMAARVVHLVVEGVALPSQILCLTFTNKAAAELARRVREATAGLGLPEGDEATVLTYHAFGQRLLEDYGARLGLEPGAMLLTEAHRWQIALSLLEDRTFDHVEVRHIPTVLGYCLTLNDDCADHLVTPAEVIAESRAQIAAYEGKKGLHDIVDAARKRCEIAELVVSYQERKEAINAFDFGDLIALANELVRKCPDVVDEFRARFSVVLLDEYQDTNIAQARLLEALCGRDYPVFAVGDPDQNIYAWRGASLQNLLRFTRDFGDGRDHLPLYVNFRSGSRILAVADRVISEVPVERRVEGKILEEHPPLGTGRVRAFVETDERAEAARIASMILEMARAQPGEPRWTDFAILARKKRLFAPIAEVLRGRGIPVEVVDLGGLLKLPEIIDIVSWLRVLENPGRNVALTRIMQGPAWRIGYRDVVALARWSARRNRSLSEELDVDRPGDVAFALLEALDHLDDEDMTGLSDEGRNRLRDLRDLVSELRQAARGSLTDLAAAVAERTGLASELDASGSARAESARRNVANFMDFLTSFSPVEGEASLATLIAWIDAADQVEDEMEPAQPSAGNTVKLMTVHKAKGLEWPVVFVPGLAEHTRWPNASIFPDVSRQANPLRRPQTLPYELRGDRESLPAFDGKDAKAFAETLKARALEEERRLCYVALTRAQRELIVSCAYWYGEGRDPHVPGLFYREIASHDACEEVARAEQPDANPLIELRRERVPSWPRPARERDEDGLFPGGWRAAAADRSAVEQTARRLPAAERADFERQLALHIERADLIEDRTRVTREPAVPRQIGATSLIDYMRCPKLFYWSAVRPLPRRPSDAARLGTDVHKWIEVQSRGQATLIDVEDLPDLGAEERTGEPSHAERLRETWKRSRYADAVPIFTERGFLLWVEGFVIGGRIDAIFGDRDGGWEIVDYKTGRRPDDDDPLAGVQLDVYAVAATEIWGKRAEELTLTYFYLDADQIVSRPAGDLSLARERIRAAIEGVASRAFPTQPGRHCQWCDFLTFCDAGTAFVRDSAPR